jgi:hypothetical protein
LLPDVVDVVAPPAAVEEVLLALEVTVMPAETVRAVPVVLRPVSTIWWAPAAVPAGIVTLPLILPVASAVSVPSETGSEWSAAVTGALAFQPVEVIVIEPPGAADVALRVVPAGRVVVDELVDDPPGMLDELVEDPPGMLEVLDDDVLLELEEVVLLEEEVDEELEDEELLLDELLDELDDVVAVPSRLRSKWTKSLPPVRWIWSQRLHGCVESQVIVVVCGVPLSKLTTAEPTPTLNVASTKFSAGSLPNPVRNAWDVAESGADRQLPLFEATICDCVVMLRFGLHWPMRWMPESAFVGSAPWVTRRVTSAPSARPVRVPPGDTFDCVAVVAMTTWPVVVSALAEVSHVATPTASRIDATKGSASARGRPVRVWRLVSVVVMPMGWVLLQAKVRG